jgi:hypothetical protein
MRSFAEQSLQAMAIKREQDAGGSAAGNHLAGPSTIAIAASWLPRRLVTAARMRKN